VNNKATAELINMNEERITKIETSIISLPSLVENSKTMIEGTSKEIINYL